MKILFEMKRTIIGVITAVNIKVIADLMRTTLIDERFITNKEIITNEKLLKQKIIHHSCHESYKWSYCNVDEKNQ